MHNKLDIYDKLSSISISLKLVKMRVDIQTDFLIVMNENLSLSYFNGTSKDIIEFVAKSDNCLIRDIFSYLSSIYEVDDSSLKVDIVEFVRDLQWKKLITLKAING